MMYVFAFVCKYVRMCMYVGMYVCIGVCGNVYKIYVLFGLDVVVGFVGLLLAQLIIMYLFAFVCT